MSNSTENMTDDQVEVTQETLQEPSEETDMKGSAQARKNRGSEENLPEIDASEEEINTRKKKNRLILFIIIVVSLISIGASGWAAYEYIYIPKINLDQIEAEKSQEAVEDLLNTDDDVSSLGEEEVLDELPEEEVLEPDYNEYQDATNVVQLQDLVGQFNESVLTLGNGISTVRTDIKTSHGDLKQNLKVIADNQKVLSGASSMLGEKVEHLIDSNREIARKLDIVIKNIDVLREDSLAKDQILPVTVYNSGTWGDQHYLSVSPNEYPSQVFRLYVGQSVGAWTLTSISKSDAIFKHRKGIEKAVNL